MVILNHSGINTNDLFVYINLEKATKDQIIKLATQKKRTGQLQSIVVSKKEEKYAIIHNAAVYKALKELGYKEVPASWVKAANDLSEAQKKEFIIKDNVGFGSWDFDSLANDWDGVLLEEWGLDVYIAEDIDLDDLKSTRFDISAYLEDEDGTFRGTAYFQNKDLVDFLTILPTQMLWL